MGRKSPNSKQNFLAATSLRPNQPSRNLSLADQIMETKLRSEQAKLAQLEAQLPDDEPKKYTRYVDMPPPTPEDEAEFDREFQEILSRIVEEPIGPEDGQSIQDWLTAKGAVLPDLPEWKVPLYLDKWTPV